MNSVHLGDECCASVAALNHFLHTTFEKVEWDWRAICYNIFFEENYSTRSEVLFHHIDKHSFGVDSSGYLDVQENVQFFIDRCATEFKDKQVDLAISVAKESKVYHERFGGLVGAVNTLSDGGHFILQMDTMFHASTICLMYFLNCTFKEVHVYKPATSPPESCSCFIICLHYLRNCKYLDQ